jgi:hypothetical protein
MEGDKEDVMTVRATCGTLIGALLVGLVAGCSQPPPPSAATAALEGLLLTVADVGGGFVEESRGQVGVSGHRICPESDFAFHDVGMVRASFVRSTDGDNHVGLVESLWLAEPGALDTLFPALRAACETCNGLVWIDSGQTKTIEPMAVPEVGDDRVAVHALHGRPPFDGRHGDIRIAYIRSGNVLVEISIDESHADTETRQSVSNEEFDRIVAEAVAKISM